MRNPLIIGWFILILIVSGFVPAWSQDRTAAAPDGGDQEINGLIEKMGAEDFGEREAAFDALKAMGDRARPLLKKALDHDDPEIRWRASRLLTALEGKKLLHLGEADEDGNFTKLRDRLQNFKQLPGVRIEPLPDDFFEQHGDFFQGPFGGLFKEFLDGVPLRERLGSGASPGERMFVEPPLFGLEGLVDALRKNEQGLRLEIDGQLSTGSMSVQSQTADGEESYTLEIAGNGSVTATVKKTDATGATTEEVYKEESMDAFEKAYPEIADRFNLDGFSMGTPLFQNMLPNGFKIIPRASERSGREFLHPGQVRRKTLGVYINPEGPNKVLRAQLGLEDEAGIIIEEVLPDSFAAKIGLQAFDVVTAIQGVAVGRAEDVGRVLDTVNDGDVVEVVVHRNGEKKVMSAAYEESPRKF